jgi:hypothetical protein
VLRHALQGTTREQQIASIKAGFDGAHAAELVRLALRDPVCTVGSSLTALAACMDAVGDALGR